MRFLFCAALALLAASAQAFPLPPALETGHLLGRGLPAGKPPVPLQDEFFALGWSRANAFAWLERRRLENGREVRLHVVDLVDDRTLEERRWDDWGEDQAGWWKSHEAEVDAVFLRYSLRPTTWQLGEFPLILDNEYYTLSLRTERRVPDWISRWELWVNSTGRGLKLVGAADGYWRWASLLGFLPSPFENRVALVLLVQPSGWQGEAQPLRFAVTGLSLKAGFPKP